jgi:hypothetical protein
VLAMQPSLQRLRGSFPEGLPAQKAQPDATD